MRHKLQKYKKSQTRVTERMVCMVEWRWLITVIFIGQAVSGNLFARVD